jgi:hypothetical protein
MIDISIEGQGSTGGLVSTNSANQMFFRGASFTGSGGSAWDFNTMQDSYFHQCTFNNDGGTSAPVINIYGSSSGTSNMLWFEQIRVESFPGYGISITYGSGNSGNNNGMFFHQIKLESVSATKDLWFMDGSAQQISIDGLFLSQGNGSGGTAINGVNFGGSCFTARSVWCNVSTSGQLLNVIWINNPGGGPISIDNVYVDNTLASGGGIIKLDGINGYGPNVVSLGTLGGSNTTVTGDSSGATLGWGQPTHGGSTTGFTAATGTAVLAGSTFTGGVGSTTYTLTDVVAALKKLGAIVQ